ncbi:hypothetical protein [Cellulomonas xylanilytica]|uniref:Uncharacterized protein n=1 Tax=Cellulomonas xylanilytica TaxID=233583 RepID=A0A510V0N1_9CELL|nr:hypothetical protein [Cellulomonas xylanilytica]GEK20452.1 hypothetical protein CXY01_09720 [Cellulomonas xylanilytica]
MYETHPALVIGVSRGRVRVTLFLLGVFGLLLTVGSAVFLVQELLGGRTGVSEYWGFRFPSWLGFAGGVVVGVAVAWDSFATWRAAGPAHGVLDYVLEPTGLRLVHHRRLLRRQELLVERGQHLVLDATLLSSRRGGLERSYRIVVSAPGGSFAFTQDGYIEKLSLAPLEQAARQLGIEVVTTGAATEIQRTAGVV